MQECEKKGDRSRNRLNVGGSEGLNVQTLKKCSMPCPRGVSQVWQTQGLETCIFGSVAMIGLTGEFSEVWQAKELAEEEGKETRLKGESGRLKVNPRKKQFNAKTQSSQRGRGEEASGTARREFGLANTEKITI